jgi:3-dehydroquinate dehydratase-2
MGEASYRIEVMHGVNLNMLGRRDPEHYGTFTLSELEQRVEGFAAELGLRARCFQTNAEVELVERLHRVREEADGIILNPGAWTHYAWAIRDALEIAALPTVEVHLSDVKAREPWRRVSVIGDLCVASVSGQGVEGYRLALQRLRAVLEEGGA